jgi:hypothetical protein
MPAPFRIGIAPRHQSPSWTGGTTITGHGACSIKLRDVEPIASPWNLPRPREPTTSRPAEVCRAKAINAAAAESPGTTSVRHLTSGYRADAEPLRRRIAHRGREIRAAGRDRISRVSPCWLMMRQDQLDVAESRLREGDLRRPAGPG